MLWPGHLAETGIMVDLPGAVEQQQTQPLLKMQPEVQTPWLLPPAPKPVTVTGTGWTQVEASHLGKQLEGSHPPSSQNRAELGSASNASNLNSLL